MFSDICQNLVCQKKKKNNIQKKNQNTQKKIKKVLNGSYVPAGRTSVTWYNSTTQLPYFLDYNMTGKCIYMCLLLS